MNGGTDVNNNDAIALNVDLSKPRWDQSTFMGRFKHFFAITDIRKAFASDKQLDEAKDLITAYKKGLCPPGTTEDKLWQAKQLYDSAFHPDNGDKMNMFGRMSFQVPGGMAVTGLMLQFFRTPMEVALTQWFNQSFNTVVNLTNRNAASPTTIKQMLFAYATATSTAVGVAVGLNMAARKSPPIVARCIPFVAVASANCVNIPLSRQVEIMNGISVTSDSGEYLGKSVKCAKKGISQVVTSRIAMAAPGMVIIPFVMERMLKQKWFRKATYLHLPFQTAAIGAVLLLMVPVACSIFPQRASMAVADLEPELRDEIISKHGDSVQHVYFNKGL